MRFEPIMYLGIQKVIDRGSAIVLKQEDDSIFIKDKISSTYMIATKDYELGKQWLLEFEHENYSLLAICGQELARYAKNRYQFSEELDCYQFAYQKKELPLLKKSLSVRTATIDDLSMIMEYYKMIEEEEMREVIKRKNLLIGYAEKEPVGFVGEHLEGSMGMLYVFPRHRGKGYGSELEKEMIIRTMQQGFVPYCQVETSNEASIKLQKGLGLERSQEHIYWLF